ncbi:MAG: PilN domain-containing protein, partial [Fibrobacteraceae bacterium]
GLCLDRSCEVLVAELERKGFAPLQVIPSAFLYPSMFSVQPDLEGEIFIRATDTYYDIWIYGEGVFQAYHRIVKDRITSFFNQFCPEHYPAVASFPVRLLNGDTSSVDSLQKEIGLSVTIVAQKHDILESLAEDAWLFGWEKLPSLGTGKDTIPSKRLHESAAFRKVLKIAGTFLAFSLALVGVLGLFVAGYGFYTRSDRIDLEKKASIGRELSSMSEKLEKDRVEAESLLRHRTRHASPLSLLVQALPEGMWLTRWDIQGGRYFIQGFATEAQDVSIFLSRLEESPAFTQVRLRTTEKTNWKRKPVVRFDLVAEEK